MACRAKRAGGRGFAWLLLFLIFLPLLLAGLAASRAEARPDPEPVVLCKHLLPAFVEEPSALTARSHDAGPDRPSEVRLDWLGVGGGAESLTCRFLPLARTGGLWQLDGLRSSHYGELSRYDLLQLMKFLRPPVQAVAERAPRAAVGEPWLRGLLYAAQQAIALAGLTGLYGLLAIGFTLTLAVGGVFNLAYGLIYTFAAFQAWLVWLWAQLLLGPDWLWVGLPLLLVALAGGAAAGYVSSAFVLAPGRRRAGGSGRLAIIASLGLLIAGEEAFRLLQGAETYWLPYRDGGTWLLAEAAGFPLVLGKGQSLVLALVALILLGLSLFLRRSRGGLRMRAVADDPGAAALLGVDLGATVALATTLGGVLAALAGGFAFFTFGAVNFHLGAVIGFKALAAAILGGVGSPAGALLGALVIAMVEIAVVTIGVGAWKEAAVFALLVAGLLFRPQGLLGRSRSASPEFIARGRGPF